MGLTALSLDTLSQDILPLYPGKIPNSIKADYTETKNMSSDGNIRYGQVSKPTLQIFLPPKEKANGTAVIVIPGGGYRIVSYVNEGIKIAEAFNKLGVTAFALKYRLPSDSIMKDKTIGPLQDVQQAIKTIREDAAKWNIAPDKVGVIGFSAGGHLASTAGTHFNQAVIENKNNTSLRPDFMILAYPVISFSDSLMHKGSRNSLLGDNPSEKLVRLYSNELQVTPQAPPAFLFHAADDQVVKVQNSLRFYEALVKNQVSAEMHLYPKGGHGFGLNNKTTSDRWIDRVENWMKSLGLL